MGKEKKLRTLFTYIGGKFYIAKNIIQYLPEHECYVEPFVGAGSVFFNKSPAKVEVINDINKDIANLYHCLAFKYDEFVEKLQWMIPSRALFKFYLNEMNSKEAEIGDVDRAVKFISMVRMSFAGNSDGFGTSKQRKSNLSYLLNNIDSLKYYHDRLKNAYIECLDFEVVMDKYDSKDTLFYLDPPYYGAEHYYNHGFSKEDHIRMLNKALSCKGKVVISGYDNEIYNEMLKDLKRVEFDTVKHSYGVTKYSKQQTRQKAKDVLWIKE